ncbi:sialate O-acetylesterase [Antarcticibacterium sp. 1MA-6-2]|uniref:sialate O-acetylesterase n=1 Tax=Antarcticibacterium sp. 1MA-6-2 TaxID=2908210 RepID=UPI001F331D56|nr:sialate O-acetylesterase [Antarcticibacterium sp. 1MA-6-2]UJH92637.1 sialate O-acetylesterase [Antarcticibacterium sp. 1MA-6-2]
MCFNKINPSKFGVLSTIGEEVIIDFSKRRYKTKVNDNGAWEVKLREQKYNTTPQTIRVQSGENETTLKNILIGDLWLLIGQSNMEWPMEAEMHYENELPHAKNSKLRFYNPKYVGKNIYGSPFNKEQVEKLEDGELFYDGKWEVSDTSSIKKMSAIGYYFGKAIINSENIPIGLINLSIGGAPLETFIDTQTLKENPKFSTKISETWLENNFLPIWIRERGMENIGNNSAEDKTTDNHAYKPGFAFSSAIEPLLKMPVKGVLWYQGESNAQEMERVKEYRELQKLMLEDYRERWNNKNLPFYYVQLSSIDTAKYDSHYWPEFRDGQRRFLDEIKNVGMAVSSDIGNKNDVHPRNKKVVGERLARWALKTEYGRDVLPSGPLVKKVIYKGGNIVVEFKYA